MHTLIIESTNVAITTALLAELTKRKIKVIFCDEKHDPNSELIPLYGDTLGSKKINIQINWQQVVKDQIWEFIVRQKILNQANVLSQFERNEASQKLLNYAKDTQLGDCTNREGHAAKVYFNALFGQNFTRGSHDEINSALNYGYTLLLSSFNRSIVMRGYLTQLGIHHKNPFNPFNLSCDFIEPFRPIVDHMAKKLNSQDDFKVHMQHLFEKTVIIADKRQTINNAILIYTDSVLNALEFGEVTDLKLPERHEI
jgi:CRISPR-associated endonuclease Cas1 subtype II